MDKPLTVRPAAYDAVSEEVVIPSGYHSGRSLHDYWFILRKRRWPAMAVLLALLLTVGLYSFTAAPVYKATTQILIDRESPKLLDLQQLAPADLGSEQFYQTQYKLLESRALARKVMEKLNLREHPRYGKVFARLPEDPEPVEVQRAEESLISNLLINLEITPIRNSRLVEVSFSDNDPVFAAKVVNTLAKSYIDHALDMRFAAAQEASRWLQQKLAEARQKLEESEDRLSQYQREHNIVIREDKEAIVSQKLSQLNQELVTAQTRRLEAETRFNQVSQGLPIAEVLNNPVIQQLKGQEARVLAEIADLANKYGELHPRRQRLAGELEAIRSAIGTEMKTIAQSIRQQYQMAKEQEGKLLAAMEDLKDETREMGDKAIQYQVLWRDVQANRAIYENMLKSLKETTATQNIPATHIKVVYPATPPSIPVAPKKVRNLALALILGLVGGAALALTLENLDNTLKSPEEMEAWLEVPNLAVIPHLDLASSNGNLAPALVVEHQPRSLPAESYRTLRTNIMFSSPGQPPGTLLVTSAQPDEGKTVTAANLATAMAKAANRVLLVDADLRRPSLHQLFETTREPGLSNYLVGESDDLPVVATAIPNLWLIPAGPITPNPSELLQSERMRQFLATVRTKFDRIILDSPPLLSVTDAVILATMVDGVLQVVKAEATSRQAAQEARDQIHQVQGRHLGTILNDISLGRDGYYYNYYYYRYHSYYQDEDGSNTPNLPVRHKTAAPAGFLAWLRSKNSRSRAKGTRRRQN